ncbi:DNA end-binding protein Ku [Bradyrhizobium sp. CIR3A]|nr:DNA end-binding protein Ku [Bradyrhizobium sp. CIR3A]
MRADSQYSAGRGASGPAADGARLRSASAAQFFHLFRGRHAPARGSVGHAELEHNKNKCRVRLGSRSEKFPLGLWPLCRNQAKSFVLNPLTVSEFPGMAPRANWKGFLRLSLVTCPVALYPATSESEKVSFNQLNRKTGHRIKYAKVDADTGEEVDNEDIVKGYKVDTDTFIEVTKEELENVALESTRTIEIDEFVDRSEIDPRYLIRPYYLRPDGKVGHDAFSVILETIREMNKVAIGRVVLTNREHIIALEPLDKGLMGTLLRYPYEVRPADEYFDDSQDVKVTKDMLDLAKHIVNQKAGHFEPDKFEDQYETALIDLINQKRAGKPITAKARPRGENVVDLMDALRKSIGREGAATEAPKKSGKKPRKAAAGQKEMLMPIAGKKPAKEAAAKKPAAKPQRKSA